MNTKGLFRFLVPLLMGVVGLASSIAFATDCEFLPRESFCDVRLDSSADKFLKVLGKPSAIIPMKESGIGYIFSNGSSDINFMMIFRNGRIDELRSWASNPNIDFWRELPEANRINITFNGINILGKARREVEALDKTFPQVDAGEYGENRTYLGSTVDITYLQFYAVGSDTDEKSQHEYERFKAQAIDVRNLFAKP